MVPFMVDRLWRTVSMGFSGRSTVFNVLCNLFTGERTTQSALPRGLRAALNGNVEKLENNVRQS